MKFAIIKPLVFATLILSFSTAHAYDLKTTTFQIKKAQAALKKLEHRRTTEKAMADWYRKNESALAAQRTKFWEIIPTTLEQQHSNHAEYMDNMLLMEADTQSKLYQTIFLYSWAYVVVHDREANYNRRLVKSLTIGLQQGMDVSKSIEKAIEKINDAQAKETASMVSNMFGYRSGMLYSKMGSKATKEAYNASIQSLRKAYTFFSFMNDQSLNQHSTLELNSLGPSYSPIGKSVNSAMALNDLSDFYEVLNTVSYSVKGINDSLIDDINSLKLRNNNIAINFALKVMDQK